MKLKFTLLTVAAALVLFVTSCKKDGFKAPVIKTGNADSVKLAVSHAAVSFYKAVTGAYGGADIKNGIKVLNVAPEGKRGPVLFSTDPLCGYVIDTVAATKTVPVNDTTTYSYGGEFIFTYTCSSTTLDGYTNRNDFFNVLRTTNTMDSVHVSQRYTVKALDNTYKLVSMDGSLVTAETMQVFNGPYYYSYLQHVNTDIHTSQVTYTLHNVKVDVSSGTPDMTSGTASMVIFNQVLDIHHPYPPSYSYGEGQITFLGNHLAHVEIHYLNVNADYIVNMQTGQIVG